MSNDWKKPQPAPSALWRLVHYNFTQTRFDGIYCNRNIAGKNTPSLHAEGRALDIGLSASKPTEKHIADQLFKAFVDLSGPMGLQEVIWNHQIWSVKNPMLHPYHGVNPHTDHIHVGFTRNGSQRTTFTPMLLIKIAVIRTGLEDLATAQAGTG